jgi:hypothetical protein
MNAWSETSVENVDLEALVQVIRDAGRPVHVNVLAQAAVRTWLEAEAGKRHYVPGAKYVQSETIWFNNQPVMVKAVRAGSNPKQGHFTVLTLVLPDGTERYVAGEVVGAPAQDREPVSEERVRAILDGEEGLAIRTVVQEALDADDQFVWFQDAQGDHWCLAEMLPEVKDEDLTQVWSLLHGLLKEGILSLRPTEGLVKAIWEQENDGSDTYLLKAFALNTALQRCQEARWLGDGWALEAEWQQLQERTVLVGPREENVVAPPAGIKLDAKDEEQDLGEGSGEGADSEGVTAVVEEDLEAWRRKRRLNVTVTLRASHYYGNWLPLTQDMRQVFPPLASESYGITFYHRLGGEEVWFPAWVDWDQGRILGSPQMYQAFYEHGIYPGARLVISHRGTLWEYDVRTKPLEGEQRVRVRRVFLSEDGELEYEEVEEPLRYQVDGDVFVADARWEELPALFQQAEEASAGIFQLMYEKCCKWWEAGGRRPLYVTAQELFEAIHYCDEGRLTSKATIAWELWRRLAFRLVGSGKYLFRPEKGDRTRSVGLRRHSGKAIVAARPGPKVKKDRFLKQIVGKVGKAPPSAQPVPKAREEQEDVGEFLWKELMKLVGQELRTLHEKNPFTVNEVQERQVRIAVGATGSPRTIRREEIELAWERLVEEGSVSLVEIKRRFSDFNPAYVTAILAALHGVTHRTEPIRLFYSQEAEPEVVPEIPSVEEIPEAPALERRRDGQLVAPELVPLGPLFAEAPEEPEAASEDRPPATPTEPAELPSAEEVHTLAATGARLESTRTSRLVAPESDTLSDQQVPSDETQVFVMVMGNRDTRQKIGYSRDIYIPLAARSFNPSFWRWPDGFSIASEGTIGRYRERRIDILVRPIAVQPQVVQGVRIYYYDKKHEFRLNCGRLVEGAVSGDILVIQGSREGATFEGQAYEYEATVISSTHPSYSTFFHLCTHKVKGSPKRWGYPGSEAARG